MPQSRPDICYVSAPIGRKHDPSQNVEIDFDDIYVRAIVPAFRAAGLECARVDALTTRGVVHKAIYSAILSAPVMLADITLANPNVLYELGLRHAISRRGTVIINAYSSRPPFDLASMRWLGYHIEGGRLSEPEADRLIEILAGELREARENDFPDSPIFDLFPGYGVTIPAEIGSRLITRRDPSESLRRSLLDATRGERGARLSMLQPLEGPILARAASDPALAADLLTAYRDASAWGEVVRVAEKLPSEVGQRPLVQQQLAMALNRRGLPGDRERATGILLELAHTQGDAETYGMLGRIFKDRYRETGGAADLDAAVEHYRHGHERSSSDYYAGINLVTLLKVKGDPNALQEIQQLLPGLRQRLEKEVESGRVDYWNVATRLELECVTGDWPRAESLVLEARLRAPSSWMLGTTAQNLRFLASRSPLEDQKHVEQVVGELLESTGGG